MIIVVFAVCPLEFGDHPYLGLPKEVGVLIEIAAVSIDSDDFGFGMKTPSIVKTEVTNASQEQHDIRFPNQYEGILESP